MKKRVILICCALLLVLGVKIFAPEIKGMLVKPTAYAAEQETAHSVTIKNNQYLFFGAYNDEPILWRVLEVKGGKTLLLSENVITFKAMNAADAHHRYGSSDYESSTIKQWLNSTGTVEYTRAVPSKENVYLSYNAYAEESGFLSDNHFSAAARAVIAQEGVFLPEEALLKQYLSEEERIKYPSAGAVKQDEAPFVRPASQGVWYFTASKNEYSSMSVVAVTSSGGFYKTPANDGTCGIAPAMKLKQTALPCTGGEGTKDSPYYVTFD
ncbi:MAG: hypothetical protein IKE65_08405 [Clostridia bacterium]|nr:hypothetical protein [Clostridia bacterium]